MSDSSVDRNLLFCIIALQMDFVSRDQLVASMEAWVANKAKPIGAVMVERGALGDEHLQLLDALLHKHLENHEHDAAKI